MSKLKQCDALTETVCPGCGAMVGGGGCGEGCSSGGGCALLTCARCSHAFPDPRRAPFAYWLKNWFTGANTPPHKSKKES